MWLILLLLSIAVMVVFVIMITFSYDARNYCATAVLSICLAVSLIIYTFFALKTFEKDMKICPECKQTYKVDYEYCKDDGTELEWR